MLRAALLLAAALAAAPGGGAVAQGAQAEADAAADATAAGQAAFDRRDYAEAERQWGAAATAGSAAARFGLGLIHDLGLGRPRDAAMARRWWLAAAASGHALAQFNVAVMLDSGADGLRDVEAAALWYGHAAARGAARAPFNLGLLYAAGDGAPKNPAVAAAWMAAAGAIPAARGRVAALAAEAAGAARVWAAPAPLGGLVADGAASLVWSLAPAPEGAALLVELADDAGRAVAAPLSRPADGPTAALVALPQTATGPLFWRVSLIDPDGPRHATAGWRRLSGAGAPPRGRVVFSHAPGDAGARRLAAALSADFSRAGFWTETVAEGGAAPGESPGAILGTAVTYAFPEDADLARAVAASLPALDAAAARRDGAAPASPGAVRVRLSGGLGPAPASAAGEGAGAAGPPG